MHAASLVVFAELDWNPSTMEQAICRAHRIGQTQEVNVYYLIASSTADDLIWTILQKKEKTLTQIGFAKEDKEKPTVSSMVEKKEVKWKVRWNLFLTGFSVVSFDRRIRDSS